MDSWDLSGDRSLIEAFSKLMFTRILANTTSRYYRNGLPSSIYIYTHTVLIYMTIPQMIGRGNYPRLIKWLK